MKISPDMIEVFNRCSAKPAMDFDLLKSAYSSLNENAHTRILVALLKISAVCKSFFAFLDRCYPGRGLARIVGEGWQTNEEVSVRCFENYMDALVAIGNIRVIIENKVNGASDRPEQIDRYVQTVLNHGTKEEDLFVLYLTRFGGEPSEDSFRSAKQCLCYANNSKGRFFPLSYSVDMLCWLNEILAEHIELRLAEDVREAVLSGVVQYRHYLRGSDVLSLRQADGESEFREYALSKFGSDLEDVCVAVEFERLCLRQYAVRALNDLPNGYKDEPEKRQVLKLLFYRMLNRIIPDEEFYQTVESNDGDLIASMGMWEEKSLVQVDVWCKSATSSDSGIKELINKVKGDERLCDMSNVEMKYNSHDMVRFRIDRVCDLMRVVEVMSEQFNVATSHGSDLQSEACNDIHALKECTDSQLFINWMKATFSGSPQCLAQPGKCAMWKQVENNGMIATRNYRYVNGWAIQLYESPDDPVRAFDVFGNTGTSDDDLLCLQDEILNQKKTYPFRCMRWYGRRLFLRFPLPTEDYAKELLEVLWRWRENQKKVAKF